MTTRPAPKAANRPHVPFYPRVLRLRHVHLSSWQRAVLGEGSLAVAAVLVLADVVSSWALLIVPLLVAALVKAHDLALLTLPPQARPARAQRSQADTSVGSARPAGSRPHPGPLAGRPAPTPGPRRAG